MKYALDSNSMSKIDEYTIEELNISAMVLMERAALETTLFMKKHIKEDDRILVLCGPGNNGGDGIAVGRILHLQGYHVAIFLLCQRDKVSQELDRQLIIAEKLGMTMVDTYKPVECSSPIGYSIVIDAIFGVGLVRDVTGYYKEIMAQVNMDKNLVFSLDIPSGISTDDGKVMNQAIRADYTITYAYMKQGLLVYPGVEYAGKISLVDIGLSKLAEKSITLDTFYYEEDDLEFLAKRHDYSHKGSYGKVLVIAGNKGMSGAAFLSAKAAYRSGAGLVKVLTSSSNREILQTLLPEAIISSYEDKELLDVELRWADVVVIGPGMGISQATKELLNMVIKRAKVPLIIDADGINILADKMDREGIPAGRQRVEYLKGVLKEDTILTPHLKELSRLLKTPVNEISDNIIDTANQCSYNNKVIYLIKDAKTIVTYNGMKYINRSGSNAMATGGSGDVLTGIIGALIGQKMKPYSAACLAVYIHGLAGQFASAKKGNYSVMASDILDSIEDVLKNNEGSYEG